MVVKKIFLKMITVVFVLALGAHILGPQAEAGTSLKTEPSAAPLNPKALAVVKIMGSGFQAEDRVEITMVKANKGKDVNVAFAEADSSGKFETKMNILSILQGIFNFRFKKGKPTPDPNNPPIPPGKYTLKASSWDSKAEASCVFEITVPPKKK
ncbi:MAG: hypothetical protein V2J25_04920 [Desulfatiglans sp.]|jgi:hypothetical protein|nr:hypothetical protein [Thermodesulfobacteriota bacterium]MEE4352194.1 hypothetical protein [Desulfatiglans sp.]